jgi:hypothetical protein
MSEKEEFYYDEDDSVKFIRNYLPQELKEKFSDDDIIYVVDLVYEFYDSKGYLNEEEDEEKDIEIDENELVEYVEKNAKKDGIVKFEPEEIIFIVQGELDYCDSIDMFLN